MLFLFPGNRIPCPVQSDPTKYQRENCWAITDTNIREAVIKIFEFTTCINSEIITVEMPSHTCPHQRATYYIDLATGNTVYFRKGGKQDGKLWSLANFDPDAIDKMIKGPNVKKITDIPDNNQFNNF